MTSVLIPTSWHLRTFVPTQLKAEMKKTLMLFGLFSLYDHLKILVFKNSCLKQCDNVAPPKRIENWAFLCLSINYSGWRDLGVSHFWLLALENNSNYNSASLAKRFKKKKKSPQAKWNSLKGRCECIPNPGQHVAKLLQLFFRRCQL